MNETRGNKNKQISIAKKARLDYDKITEKMKRKTIKHIRTGQTQNLMGSGSHKNISNCLKGGGVQPLKVLEIPNSNGVLTTDENKIDKIAREAWEKVFKGNIQDEDEKISNFMGNTKATSTKVKRKS